MIEDDLVASAEIRPSDLTAPVPDYFDNISVYLPMEMRSAVELTYFTSHMKSFTDNQDSNIDYSILALHRIFMFSAYGLLYACLHDRPELSRSAFIIAPVKNKEDRRQLQSISSLFTLSLLNESTFFDLISLVGCDTDGNMRQLKQLVDGRNELAHCNGKMCADFEGEVNKYAAGFNVLHDKFLPVMALHLTEINDFDFGATRDVQIDQLRTFLSEHYLSRNMLRLALPIAKSGGLTKRTTKLLEEYLDA